MIFRCPICKSTIEREAKEFPFCSERCKVIDLASWADGSYAIAGEPATVRDELVEEPEERVH